MQVIGLILSSFVLCFWLYFVWMGLALDRLQKKLSIVEPLPTLPPKVSVVIAAKNEGANVEPCLNALEKQTYRNLEIILVNDRSTDETGSVMQKYTTRHSSWKYIEIVTLPDRWIGKTNALEQGGKTATGDFIVFSDGDVVYSSDAVEKAMQTVITHHLDHLVMSATLHGTGILLHAMQTIFTMGMVSLLRLHKVGSSPKYYVGAGIFNLVKTSLYRSLGGHESIRLEVIDDLMLGKIMVLGGGKAGFMNGRDLIKLDWYPNWKAMIHGLEKNAFASIRYSIPRLLIFGTFMFSIFLFPYAGLFLSSPIFWISIASLVLSHSIMALVGRRTGHRAIVTLFLPIAVIMIAFAFFRSTWITLSRGAVIWRDTSYSLKVLKEHTKI